MKMRKHYDFKKSEQRWQKFWEKEKIYKFNPKTPGKIFSVDTPPPTLSGKMHIGHAFSYTHQDIIARYHRMKGENVFYPFGTDNNGLATARLVEKLNKVRFFEFQRDEFIKLCQKTIKKILPDFISDWKRIGVSCDFSKIYSTISPEVQKLSQYYFIELFKQGRIYRKESPTLWCPECQTAIAQAELKDQEIESIFNDIEFSLENDKKIIISASAPPATLRGKIVISASAPPATLRGKIIISTTRPELLPSCVAIFVHPKDKRYKALIGKTAIVPLFGQKVKILADSQVDPEKGTGIVMCCTFGDTTDVDWYFKHKLPLRISITKDGKMNELAREFAGLPIKVARKKIIEKLQEKGLLKAQRKITHIVNVHERCGHEIEILPTSQWFIKYLDLKDEFLKQANKLNWYPKYMKVRLDNWIKGLRWDWCVSRQRYFGIPIPVWYCKNCGEIILPNQKDLPIDPLRSKPKKKCKCGSKEFIPETDVLDTWVTSSLTPQIALSLLTPFTNEDGSRWEKRWQKMFPMSLRPQAHDIINFWLFYTLARSYLHFKKIPWRDVMISGFVLDPKGEKMSKSKGNVVDPQTVIEKYGTDAMRYWAAQADLGDDLRYSEEEIKLGKRTVTKIWNASRFCIMHLKGYFPKPADRKYLKDEDKWILTKLYEILKEYTQRLDKYQYARAKEVLDNFFWKDFCDNYLEIVKLRVYPSTSSGQVSSGQIFSSRHASQQRRAAQFTLYTVLLAILKLYAPFMPFITEEVYQGYFRQYEKGKSIHKTLLPKLDKKLYFPTIAKNFELAIDAIVQIRKYKSEHQLSMKAELDKISVKVKNSTERSKLKKYLPLISKLMSVKEIEVK